jgi:small subunit ribosomal protein S9
MTTTTQHGYYLGTGRRKTAVARVRLREGIGQIIVNGRHFENYFTELKDRKAVTDPLYLTGLRDRVDVFVNVRGGGFTGQAGAIRQGVARALVVMFNLDTSAAANQAAAASAASVAAEGEGSAEAAAAAATAPVSMAKKLRDSGFLTRDSRMVERKKYGRKGARRSFQFSKR